AGDVSLLSFGSGNISQSAGSISGNSLFLFSTSGNLGSGTNPINTNISNLSAFSGNSIFLNGTGANANANLVQGAITGTVTLTATNSLNTAGTVFGGTVNLQTSSLGTFANITSSGTVFGNTINVHTQAGSITANGTLFASGSLSMQTQAGSM